MKRVYLILFLILLLSFISFAWAVDGVNTVNHPAKVNGVTAPDVVNSVSGLAAGGAPASQDIILMGATDIILMGASDIIF